MYAWLPNPCNLENIKAARKSGARAFPGLEPRTCEQDAAGDEEESRRDEEEDEEEPLGLVDVEAEDNELLEEIEEVVGSNPGVGIFFKVYLFY